METKLKPIKGVLKVEKKVQPKYSKPYTVRFAVQIAEGEVPKKYADICWKSLGVEHCLCKVFHEPSCEKYFEGLEDANKLAEKVKQNFIKLVSDIQAYMNTLKKDAAKFTEEEIPFEIIPDGAEPEANVTELIESALQIETPPTSKWTKRGEIIEHNGKKFICGTGTGHFYPVIYEKGGVYIGVREVKKYGGIRIRVQTTPGAKLSLNLSGIEGFIYKERDDEVGHHYSNDDPVTLEEAVAIVKRCIDVLSSSS